MAEEYASWCPDIGMIHDWSPWEQNQFFNAELREDRFCSKCGGMETRVMDLGSDA